MQHNNSRRSDGTLEALEKSDTLTNAAKMFSELGWGKRLCDLKEEEVLGMVAYFQKMKEIRDEFTEQGLLEFEQSITSSNATDDLNDPIPF